MARANRGATVSAQQDWSAPDRVPDDLLKELLWDYIKGGEADDLRSGVVSLAGLRRVDGSASSVAACTPSG